jgi:hypothetical protein
MDFQKIFDIYKQKNIYGKYVTPEAVEKLIIPFFKKIYKTGKSVNSCPIYSLKFGSGKTKMLFWSQMHGNEPTTTKALIDFIYFLNSSESIALKSLKQFTFVIIPMLNPDGSKLYTRENANKIDINRDFYYQTQPETLFLLDIYNKFKPDFCFNLHDQRSIFAAGYKGKPATLSFLAPSYNEKREYNTTRLKAIQIINFLNENLQKQIPNQIGRFDDDFNINCAGDYFTFQNTPTILIEAGHFYNDYEREITRKYVFNTFIYILLHQYENDFENNDLPKYLNISQNFKHYYDIIFKNVKFIKNNSNFITNFALQYIEELCNNKIIFTAYIQEIGELTDKIGHIEYDAQENLIYSNDKNFLNIGDKAHFKIGNNNFNNGTLIN